jgi:serine/threonine-protein kinase
MVGGRYQLHTMLGRGGMAAVWAGIDTRLDRPVAVKLLDRAASLDPSLVQLLDREARLVARLDHPNIVTVFDVGRDRGMPYIVMELVEGEDLRRRLEAGPLTGPQAITIADQVCAATAAAHAAGVVHGDIKPDNILLTRTASVKVCDFGIARLNASPHGAGRSPVAVGTSEYMAPEQATGAAVDARTDLYALGCVIYTMLSGGPPFSGDPTQVLWQQIHQLPKPIAARPDVPPDLRNLVTALLAKDPADRPASAAEVRSRLAPLLGPPDVRPIVQPADESSIYARARVVTPTRSMPAMAADPAARPARTGLRVGPLGIAGVAVGAAVVTVLIIGILSAIHPTQPVGAPPPSSQSTVSASQTTASEPPVTPTTEVTSVDGVRAAIEAQVQDGQVNADDASQLSDALDEVDRDLGRSRFNQALDRLNEVRDQLNQLLSDSKISQYGYDAILNAVNDLAAAITQAGQGNGQ